MSELSGQQGNTYNVQGEDYGALYHVLFEHHHLPVLIIDPADGRIIDANLTAIQFYQYTKEMLKSMTIYDINTLSPEDVRSQMSLAKKRNKNSFHFRHRLKDGQIREVKVDSIPVVFNYQSLLFSLITDVTDVLEKNSFFQTLFDQSPNAIVIMDSEYRMNRVNEHFEALFGYTAAELTNYTPPERIYPDGNEEVFASNKNTMEQGLVINQDTIRRHKDGTWIEVQLIAIPVYVGQMQVATCAIYIDKREEAALKSRNHMLASVLENTTQGAVITNGEAEIQWVNQAYTTITGYTSDEVMGENPRLLQSGEPNKAFYQTMWQAILDQGGWSGEIWNRRKSGEVFPEYLKIFSVRGNNGEIERLVGIINDISESKAYEKHITSLMNHDELTSLFNRSYIMRAIRREIKASADQSDQVTVIYGDIDAFKNINDSLGHAAGDKLLIKLASLINNVFHQSIVGRISGDEFVIIPYKMTNRQVEDKLDVLFNILSRPFRIHGHDLFISCSFGIASYPEDGANASELLMNADIAMYRAKSREGNAFEYFSKKFGEAVKREFRVKTALQQADYHQEFIMNYQPIINVETNHVTGVEALIRWESPTLGGVSPGEFIPIAEKYGYIHSIGNWVLRQVCTEMLALTQKREAAFTVSINVSVQQLESDTCVENIKAILAETTFPAAHLILEVTEETSISNSTIVRQSINDLVKLGIRVSIDDFGTGYSSLEKLHRLSVHELKIDQSFVQDIENTTGIVEAIIAMGKSLSLQVVAEGVETQEQFEFLKQTKCDYVQGYFFSKPLPLDAFEKYLNQSQQSS